jgi:Rrf2 family protein
MRLELTRRADYAIRTSICLAYEGRGRLVPAPDIARRMDVPPRFLPQIMQDLVRAGLVEATPGRGGGYRLTRAPGEVSLLEVIEAVEGDVRRRTCVLRASACSSAQPCGVHELFAEAQDAMLERLAVATVLDASRGANEGFAALDAES